MDDLISRQAVLDYIDTMPSELTSDGRRMVRRIRLTEYIADTLPSAQPEITEDDVKEYCRKRCLIVVTSDLYYEMTRRWASAQPETHDKRTETHECDLINRQAAIDALGEEPEVWTGKDEYAQGLNNQWHYGINAIKAVPSADIAPCDVCKYNPPSSMDGKPCCVCRAERRTDD